MARRVNIKFLTILTVVVVGLGLMALIAKRFVFRESPDHYVKAASELVDQKKYTEAIKDYERALTLNPRKPDVWLAYGDTLNQLSPTDLDYLRRARDAWQQALAVDPSYKPALNRLFSFWSDLANMNSTDPGTFKQLKDFADRLHQVDPSNDKAEIAVASAVVRPWLAGNQTDEAVIRKALDQLQALLPKYPQNADLPLYIAQAKLKLADSARQRDRADDATKLINEANAVMDASLKGSPTASMYYSAAQVAIAQEQITAMQLQRSDVGTAKAQQQRQALADQLKQLRQKTRDLYAKARDLSKDKLADAGDNQVSQIYINSARALASEDKPQAEKILRELCAARPNDQQARIALAEQLVADPGKRDEAMAIVDKPFASSDFTGPRAYLVREVQMHTLADSADWHIDAYSDSRDETQKKIILTKIKDNLDIIRSREGESVRLLRLRGKLFRAQGDMLEAIQTLEKARQMSDQAGQSNSLERWDIIDMLARAYLAVGQTGRAKDMLTELVNRFPTYDRSRLLLAQLLIRDGQLDQARPQVAFLAKRLPDNVDVLKLQIQLGTAPNSSDQSASTDNSQHKLAMESYSKLPEDNKAQIMDKVSAAVATAQVPEVGRLINKGLSKSPGDIDLVKVGVSAYRRLGDADAAKALVASALKEKPTDPELQLIQKQVAGLSVEGLMNLAIEQAKQNPDKFSGELIQANAYRRLNKPKETLEHLLAAQKLKPEDPSVLSQLFDYYLWQHQFDQAEALLPQASKTNADQANGTLFRFRLAMAKQDVPTALAQARELVSRMGEFAQAYVALGQAQQASHQFDDALKSYSAALDRQSDNVDAFRGAIECCYALNRPADAAMRIRDARRTFPSNPIFQEMEIQHELTYGDPTRAIPAREEQYKRNPDDAQATLALGQAYLAGARAMDAKGDADSQKQASDYTAKAKEIFRKGIDKWPDEIAFYAFYADIATKTKQLGDTEQLLKGLTERPAFKDRPDAQLLLAQFYASTGHPADAEARLRDILGKDPSNVDVEIKMANLLASENKLPEALKVLEANSKDPQVARRRVDLLVAAGHADEAEKALDEILQRDPKSLDVLQIAAGINIARGHFDQADAHLKQALALDANNATTHYYLGLLRASQPRPDLDAAIAAFKVGRDSPTMGSQARLALAQCLRQKSDIEGAIRELEQALQQQPSDRQIRLALIDDYFAVQPARWSDCERVINEAKRLPGYKPDAELLQREANMWSMRGQPNRAVDAVTQALTAAPQDAALNQLALNLLNKAGRYDDVVKASSSLLEKYPDIWWALQARATAQANLKNKAQAEKDFESALQAATKGHNEPAAQEIVQNMGATIGPDDAIAQIAERAKTDDNWKLVIARLQQTKGDNAAAIKTVSEVLAHADKLDKPTQASAYAFAGMIYLVTHQAEKSADCYAKLLDIAPTDMTALNNMAYLLGEMTHPPRPEEGLKYSQRAYDLMQKSGRRDAVVMDTHGWLLVLSGKVDDGIDILRQANDLKQIPDIHYHLGEAYLRKGFADNAQRELKTAQTLYKQLEQSKATIDDQMGTRIEDALNRAGQLIRQKKVADAPTGAGVP